MSLYEISLLAYEKLLGKKIGKPEAGLRG